MSKLIQRVFVRASLVIVILLGGCVDDSAKRSVISSDSSEGYEISKADIGLLQNHVSFRTDEAVVSNYPSSSIEPTLIFFLLDASGSVIGLGEDTKCDPPIPSSSPPFHRGAVTYLLSLFANLPSETLVNLHIGIARFGEKEKYKELYFRASEAKAKYLEWSNFIQNDPNNDTETDYADALKHTIASIENFSAANSIVSRHIFLFTDGFSVEPDVEIQLGRLNQQSIVLHVGLLCPNKGDTTYWINHGAAVMNADPLSG